MNRNAKLRWLSIAMLGMAPWTASFADPINAGPVSLYWNNFGASTLDLGTGLGVGAQVDNVIPNLITSARAINPAVAEPNQLLNLFTSQYGFISRTFARTYFGPSDAATAAITQPWSIQLWNPGNVLTLQTGNLVGVTPLSVLPTPTITGSTTAPTISWDTTGVSAPFNRIRVWIYDDRSNRLIYQRDVVPTSGSPLPTGLGSFNVPAGILAPNTDYSVRVMLENVVDAGAGLINNRSSSFVNHTSTSAGTSVTGTVNAVGPLGSPIEPLAITPGSSVVLVDRNVAIGPTLTAAGSLRIDPNTSLTASYLNVGPMRGTMIVDGANATVTANGTDNPEGFNTPAGQGGGFVSVGRLGGSRGYLDVLNGGSVNILGSATRTTPGMHIGRDAGAYGNVDVDGTGSAITVSGPGALINVGRAGDGRLNITGGGSVVNDAAGTVNVGRDAGARGSVLVSGTGSLLDAGAQLNVGVGGEAIVTIADSGRVKATSTTLGAGGFIQGCNGGVLQTNLTVLGGTLGPGCSPGTLTIFGNLILTEGLLLLEALGPGQIDRLIVTGDVFIGSGARIEVLLGYSPSSPLSFFEVEGTLEIENGFGGPRVFNFPGSEAVPGSEVAILLGDARFLVEVTGVPVAGTLALLVIGAAGMVAGRRTRTTRSKTSP